MLRGGAAIEEGGGGKDVYLNNFIIYHHFVQCPPKLAAMTTTYGCQIFSSLKQQLLLVVRNFKILTTRTSGYQKLETF